MINYIMSSLDITLCYLLLFLTERNVEVRVLRDNAELLQMQHQSLNEEAQRLTGHIQVGNQRHPTKKYRTPVTGNGTPHRKSPLQDNLFSNSHSCLFCSSCRIQLMQKAVKQRIARHSQSDSVISITLLKDFRDDVTIYAEVFRKAESTLLAGCRRGVAFQELSQIIRNILPRHKRVTYLRDVFKV